ncbi:MAG: hypothetical protein HQK50_12370 [Oligoflexia bacterium]|nr:hypothetical protein [Oligoflexia bacterium]MBF0366361.1 hypothetical protein [Oligoflexia bacterium]
MLKKLPLVTMLLLTLLFSSSCLFRKQIPLIKLDENGNEKVTFIPYRGYSTQTAKLLNEMDEKVIDTLEKNRTVYPSWELKMFYVGISVGASAKIPLVVGIEGSASLYLYFSKM